MMARSDGNAARALREGAARVLSAPAVLAGTLALTLVFSLEPGLFPGTVVLAQYTAIAPLLPFGIFLYAPYNFTWLLVWAFLAGGILDRYARNRPTRGHGFFGACGAHFPAMLRLGVAELLLFLGVRSVSAGDAARIGFLAVSLLLVYARVRLVVEDRRSAIGALLAGGRFIVRNAAAAGVFLFFAGALWIAGMLWLRMPQAATGWVSPVFAGGEMLLALQLFLVFASWASATALFQSRLAHASYTAGPAIVWPESPAAEAIANLSPPGLP
jgi:hypothetical protein